MWLMLRCISRHIWRKFMHNYNLIIRYDFPEKRVWCCNEYMKPVIHLHQWCVVYEYISTYTKSIHVLTKIYGATVRQKNACIKVIFTSASTTVTWSDLPWTIAGVVSLPLHLEFKKNIDKHIDKLLILCNIVLKIFFMHVIFFFSTYQFRFRSERWTSP